MCKVSLKALVGQRHASVVYLYGGNLDVQSILHVHAKSGAEILHFRAKMKWLLL